MTCKTFLQKLLMDYNSFCSVQKCVCVHESNISMLRYSQECDYEAKKVDNRTLHLTSHIAVYPTKSGHMWYICTSQSIDFNGRIISITCNIDTEIS